MVQESSHADRENEYTRDNAKRCRDQIHRSNTPAESVSDYYKKTITIPLLHHLMYELDYRFDSSKTEAIFNSFVIVPATLIAIVHQPDKGHWKNFFSLFANFIRDDLPNALSRDSEHDPWETNILD